MPGTIPPLGGLTFSQRRAALDHDKRLAALEGRPQGVNAYQRGDQNDGVNGTDQSVAGVRDDLEQHVDDAAGAHSASAISYDGSLLTVISQIWFNNQDDVQGALSQIIAEIDGRIEAGDVDAIVDAINTWSDGDSTITNSDVFEAELIVARVLAARAVIASKIAANAVESVNVKANAIDGESIRAGTRLEVGEGANRISLTGTDRPNSTSIRSGGVDVTLILNQGESASPAPTWDGPGAGYQFITYSTGFVLHPNGRPLLLPN